MVYEIRMEEGVRSVSYSVQCYSVTVLQCLQCYSVYDVYDVTVSGLHIHDT